MKPLLKNIIYSFPLQLFILHFRKYQVLLIFWFILGATINSDFLKTYGADALFFAPEYLDRVGALSGIIVGVAFGVFIMSWNITTFILHSKRCKFLATTTQPFLKYCINNTVLPILLMAFYFYKLFIFDRYYELMNVVEILTILVGLVIGFIVILFVSFIYFFSAEKTIQKKVSPIIHPANHFNFHDSEEPVKEDFGLRVSYYIGAGFKFRKVRNVSHYSNEFLESIFKSHHFSGIISIILAFVFLILVGFFMDIRLFQVPAAASILIFFAVMTAVIGSLTYFLQSWSLPFFILLLFFFNVLYTYEIIDIRNKAYGINYLNKEDRPLYNKVSLTQLCLPDKVELDRQNMIVILENWKKKQNEEKPVMIFINVSGGGLRSGTFVMNTMQQLDSISEGNISKHTIMISGASGGMLAAAYYRELVLQQQTNNSIKPNDQQYLNNIAKDILNPVFSSMIARDIFSPVQKFEIGNNKYVKDRGYAFEQKLNNNCGGLLGKQLKEYAFLEKESKIPLMIFNSTITHDGRKMMISTQPISFMMKPFQSVKDSMVYPDAIDFGAMFKMQDPMNILLLTALRMNATFPYVLPNVWLPSNPVIDVMDAGLRDNFGQETSLRFMENFKDWIRDNTGGVIIIQMRDRKPNQWEQSFNKGSIMEAVIKPATILQSNWYKLQDYTEASQFSYLQNALDSSLHRIDFMYVPEKSEKIAALNFHLTAREKRDVVASFNNQFNQASLKSLLKLMQKAN